MSYHHPAIIAASVHGNGPSCTTCEDLGRVLRGQSTWTLCPSCAICPCCGNDGYYVVREETRHEPAEYELCRCPAGTAFLRAHHSHSDCDITIRQSIIDDLDQVPF